MHCVCTHPYCVLGCVCFLLIDNINVCVGQSEVVCALCVYSSLLCARQHLFAAMLVRTHTVCVCCYVGAHTHIHTYTHMYTHMYTHIHTHIHTHVHTRVYNYYRGGYLSKS